MVPALALIDVAVVERLPPDCPTVPPLAPMPPAPALSVKLAVLIELVPEVLPLRIEPVPAFKFTELVPLTVSAVAPEPRAMLPLLFIVSA